MTVPNKYKQIGTPFDLPKTSYAGRISAHELTAATNIVRPTSILLREFLATVMLYQVFYLMYGTRQRHVMVCTRAYLGSCLDIPINST